MLSFIIRGAPPEDGDVRDLAHREPLQDHGKIPEAHLVMKNATFYAFYFAGNILRIGPWYRETDANVYVHNHYQHKSTKFNLFTHLADK